jgi:hypothetical protein
VKGDRAVDAGAEQLDALAGRAAAKGDLGVRVAGELAEDAAFLRRLKPSLVAARLRGGPRTDGQPAAAPPPTPVRAPTATGNGGPRRRRGPNPLAVTGVAFATGAALARLIDWRGHAHPRR